MDQSVLKNLNKEERFQIIIGTYEEYLIGYLILYNKNSEKFEFHQKFTNHAHSGSIKTISCSKNGILVSGGTDELCHIINLKKNVEVGNLIEQQGAILDLAFYNDKYLFTSSEDSSICIWNTKSWICEKKFLGHKSAVNSIAVHFSGKLLLSVSKDKTIRTWNLINGKIAFVTNLKEIPNLIRFSKDKYFIVVYDKKIDIYDMTRCGIVNSIQIDNGISCAKYLNSNLIIFGTEDGKIQIYDPYKVQKIINFDAHIRRVKDIQEIPNNLILSEDNDLYICSISSDGFLKLWNIKERNFKLLIEQNINCRPNCMTFYSKHKKEIDV